MAYRSTRMKSTSGPLRFLGHGVVVRRGRQLGDGLDESLYAGVERTKVFGGDALGLAELVPYGVPGRVERFTEGQVASMTSLMAPGLA